MAEEPVEFSVRVEQGDIADPVQQLKNAIKQMKEMMPLQKEWQMIDAQIRKIRFDALLQEGFSEQQALILIK